MMYQSWIENIPIGFCRTTLESSGKFVMVNPEFLRIFGFESVESLLEMGLGDMFIESDEWNEFNNELISDRILTGVQRKLQRADGVSFRASINARVSVGETEKKEAWIDCSVEDISSRKNAEILRASQMETLRQASLTLTASLDLKEVLDTIAKCALDLVPGIRNCHIFMYHSGKGNEITFGAALWGDGKRSQPFAVPRSDGLTMKVAQSGEPILVADIQTHPLYADVPTTWSGSIIGMPLKIGDRVVGVMNVSHMQPGAFNESDLKMLRLLGDQAAIAIENARLYEAVATEKRHLSLVYDIGKQLAPSLDSNEILDKAIRLTCQAFGGSIGMAFIYSPKGAILRCQSFYRIDCEVSPSEEQPLDIPLEEGLPGWVCMHRQVLNIPNITKDSRWKELPGLVDGMHSFLGAPILHGRDLIGALTIFHREQLAFSPDHLELIQAICHQVGVALSNVGRYEQVQRLVDLLEMERKRLIDLVERLPVGILLVDADYHPVVVNTHGNEILNLFDNGDCRNGISRLGPYSIQDLVERCNESQWVEVILDGTQKRIFEIETRILGDEQPQWVLMFRDVTQERHEQARIQMQDRLAMVGQLAAGIAHDFNNIMATILVYSDLLRKDMAMIPSGLERLAIIQQQVQRAASLIRQILDFSRRSVMEQIKLDLLPFIKEFDKLLKRVLPETIRVELNYHPGAYLVNADPTRLQQVFMNLAVNARDAMPNGGVLRFEIKRMHIRSGEIPPSPYLPKGDWISITVADTGEGIPADVIPHIFEPFFSTKPTGQGTGLGLAQAYGIIKQHGGYIDVQSQVDQGTRFSVYLPALPAQHIEIPAVERSNPMEGHGQTILVVEDDPSTMLAIQDLLEAQCYRVLVASNGNEALRIFEQNSERIDLVVSDVVMPEMGGLDLFVELQNQGEQVKILFVTGHPLVNESQIALEENRVTWLQKPFSVPEFFYAVEELIATN